MLQIICFYQYVCSGWTKMTSENTTVENKFVEILLNKTLWLPVDSSNNFFALEIVKRKMSEH